MADAQDPRSEFYRKALHVRDATPVLDTNAYANGDVLGGLMTLSSAVHYDGGGSYLHSITIIDKAGTPQNTAMYFVFFSANPTASTFTNNAAISIAAADKDKVLGVVAVTEAEYFPVGATGLSVASLRTQGLALQSVDSANDIWVAAVATEAGTYDAASNLTFRFGIAQG